MITRPCILTQRGGGGKWRHAVAVTFLSPPSGPLGGQARPRPRGARGEGPWRRDSSFEFLGRNLRHMRPGRVTYTANAPKGSLAENGYLGVILGVSCGEQRGREWPEGASGERAAHPLCINFYASTPYPPAEWWGNHIIAQLLTTLADDPP